MLFLIGILFEEKNSEKTYEKAWPRNAAAAWCDIERAVASSMFAITCDHGTNRLTGGCLGAFEVFRRLVGRHGQRTIRQWKGRA